MRDWHFKQGGRRKLINWLGIDSWIDSSIAETLQEAADYWNAGSNFFARFRLSGWVRWLNELASEGVTLLIAGVTFTYALALPAFMEVDREGWRSTGKFAITFQDRHGNEIGKRGILHSDDVQLDEIPKTLINAVLATEDRRFFSHFGIDVLGTLRALFENVRANRVVQGGSSITQQLAKNLFLTPERSLERKIKELFISFWLESRLSKNEILKLYLDRAYMGGGAFGVEAASRFYFGKSVSKVSLAEAAMLAGLFKAPSKFAPHINLPRSRARANTVLSNLVEAGFMSAGQVHAARLNPAKVIQSRTTYSPDWFLDWAYEEVQRIAREKNLKHYVLTALTTLELPTQRQAEEVLTSMIRQNGDEQGIDSGALVAMEPDGAVRAIVGGLDYGVSQFNRATHARRQPGSSFKPYVYLTALENGFRPDSTVRDESRGCGSWYPTNYDGSGGSGNSISLRRALAKSLNTVAAELSFEVGRKKVLANLKKLGIKGVKKSCSMALGDQGITVLEHVAGFATFANGGLAARPYAILELKKSGDKPVYTRSQKPPKRIFARQTIEQLNTMLQLVVEEGTGRRAQLDFTHAVGKTGTSSSYRDAWFMGFSGALVTGVWFGNDNYSPTNDVTGGRLPAVTWQNFMSVAHTSMNIPTIPGLSMHERQQDEQDRLAELKRTDPALWEAQTPRRFKKIMPDKTRAALKRLRKALIKAGAKLPKSLRPPSKPGSGPKSRAPGTRADGARTGANRREASLLRGPRAGSAAAR